MDQSKTVIVLLGPTGVGKTDLSFRIAEEFNSEIFSADSRQMYQGIEIGTAAPPPHERERIKHHFVGQLTLTDYYSAAEYEADMMVQLETYFSNHSVALVVGGSMLYIDALCHGIDDLPTVDPQIRVEVVREYEEKGLEWLQQELLRLDPEYYQQVDQCNHKRVLHAVEICRQTGQTFTSFRTGVKKERPFRIIKIGLRRDREELYERINRRVDQMVEEGLEAEARKVFPQFGLNSLNTVGLKEWFPYFRGECSREELIEKIKQHTRIYSRKQMTWFKRDAQIRWFHPDEQESILEMLRKEL